MVWTVMSKDYPGSEYAGCSEIVGYVEGRNGGDALQTAEAAYPDAHISSVICGKDEYKNPHPQSPFKAISWRDTADVFADKSARRLESQPLDGIDKFLTVTTGFMAGISALFGLRE